MARCPHCAEESIACLGKWWSAANAPVQCGRCTGLSYVPHALSSSILLGAIGVAMLGGLFAALLKSALPLYPGLAGALAVYIYGWRMARLYPITPGKVAKARRANQLTILALFLSFFS